MYTATKLPKKMVPMLILQILKKETDFNHRLSQREIREILSSEYDMEIDRKAVRRNIDNLIEMGYPIFFSEKERKTPNQKTGKIEESSMMSDLYIEHDFEDSEIRLLIDAILFSNHIPKTQRRDLINKLASQSSRHFKSRVSHMNANDASMPQSPQLFYTIDVLDEAIDCKKKVRFKYMKYDVDKKLQAVKKPDGTDRIYSVSPYQMAAKDGKYYLICNHDDFDDLSNYRIDRIADIEILENERIRPIKDLSDFKGDRLDLAEYMREHVYMYQSETIHAKFKIVRDMVSDVIDEFGTDVRFYGEHDWHVCVEAKVDAQSMFQFAKNFAPDVIVLEPKDIAEKIAHDSKKTLSSYWSHLRID